MAAAATSTAAPAEPRAQSPGTPSTHPSSKRETIVILDFGAQYSRLIARRVRECRVYCEVLPWDVPAADLRALEPRGIILSGGPSSVYEPGAPDLPEVVLELGVPVLGICYGMQLLAHRLGGRVIPGERREYGHATVEVLDRDHPLLRGLPERPSVWMSHGDQVATLPPGFHALARTATCANAAMSRGPAARENGAGGPPIVALQFHPEVAHTPQGLTILQNFCYTLCKCEPTWTPGSFIAEAVARVRGQVGAGRVLCGVSGGVDSSVAAALIHRAIGDQLTCVFVDNGLLRQDEAAGVVEVFGRHFGLNLVAVDAGARFLGKLAGVTDPEQKRRIIGTEFVRVFEEEAARLGHFDFLAQGTLYPDVIESTTADTKATHRIKTHHNVGGLPADMRFRLVEPLRWLFKDEVRAAGVQLGLLEEIVWRQPFPGPGLAVRCLGEVTAERLAILRRADAIVRAEIDRSPLARDVWQYFAVLLPVQSVGVMGDGRTYAQVVAVRAVASADAMTADWARLPHDLLATISNRIVNEVAGVNRIVYDISSKPPATIEWE